MLVYLALIQYFIMLLPHSCMCVSLVQITLLCICVTFSYALDVNLFLLFLLYIYYIFCVFLSVHCPLFFVGLAA